MCCADFNFYINRQGIQGRKGDKGEAGFSPTISVGTDTLNEYKLIIANESNSFETPNLRGDINILDNGGTYLRYDTETQQISAQGLDAATSSTIGGVYMSTDADIESMGDSSVITPADLADALPKYLQGEGAVTITQDEVTSKTKINVDLSSVDNLESRVSAAEAEIVGIQADIADLDADNTNNKAIINSHTNSIASINNSIESLQQNKQAKLTAGEGITIDENNVISSTGGGGTGDVTTAGDNTFTGSNNFTKQVSLGNGAILNDYIPIEFGTYAKTGSQVMNRGTIKNEYTELNPVYPSGSESYIVANTLKINGGYNLILDAGSIKDQDPSTLQDYTYKGKILDGDGNVILSQGNVTAGEGVTINKTDNGIEITVDNSGGGSTPSNMVTTDTEQVITGKKIIQNRINDSYNPKNSPDGLVFRCQSPISASNEPFVKAVKYGSAGVLHLGNYNGGIQINGDELHVSNIHPKFNEASIIIGSNNMNSAATFTLGTQGNSASLLIRSGGDYHLLPALNTSSIVAGDNISVTKDTTKGIVTISTTGVAGADRELSNLTTEGEKHFLNKSQITNCLLEVPQRIKYTLADGTLTIKAGSVVIVPYGTEDLTAAYPVGVTFINDNFKVYDTQFADGKFFVWAELVNDISSAATTTNKYNVAVSIRLTDNLIYLGRGGNESGTSPTSSGAYQIYYNTSTNKVNNSGSTTTIETNYIHSLPILLSKGDGTNAYVSIAQVFNGMGYIGSTIWVDKGVKGLIPNGRNEDGTLKNTEFTFSILKSLNCTHTSTQQLRLRNNDIQIGDLVYDETNNQNTVSGQYRNFAIAGEVTASSGVISNFTPKQPFRAVDYSDKSTVSGWGMPSTRYTDLTLGASNAKYTAPANGYFFLKKAASNSGQSIAITSSGIDYNQSSNYNTQILTVSCPVQAGKEVSIFYSAGGDTKTFRFIYAEGEV